MTLADDSTELAETRARCSSRLNPPRSPPICMLIHLTVLALWVALFLLVFGRGGILAWSVGLAYVSYDAVLLVFTGWHIRRFVTAPGPAAQSPTPSVGVLIAAHNEAAVLPATLRALAAQPDRAAAPRHHGLAEVVVQLLFGIGVARVEGSDAGMGHGALQGQAAPTAGRRNGRDSLADMARFQGPAARRASSYSR